MRALICHGLRFWHEPGLPSVTGRGSGRTRRGARGITNLQTLPAAREEGACIGGPSVLFSELESQCSVRTQFPSLCMRVRP